MRNRRIVQTTVIGCCLAVTVLSLAYFKLRTRYFDGCESTEESSTGDESNAVKTSKIKLQDQVGIANLQKTIMSKEKSQYNKKLTEEEIFIENLENRYNMLKPSITHANTPLLKKQIPNKLPHHWNPGQFKHLPARITLQLWFVGEAELQFDDFFGLYTFNGKPIIWTFWDYKDMPPYIKLNIETLRCHNAPHIYVATVNDAFVKTNLKDELPWFFDHLRIEHKADVIRCMLLLKFGGMWIDADTLGLSSLYPRFLLLTEGYDMFNYDWIDEPIGVAMIGPVKANSLLFQKWNATSSEIFANKSEDFKKFAIGILSYPFEWAELLSNIINPAMKSILADDQMKYSSIDGLSTWGQFDSQSMNEFNLFQDDPSNWGNYGKIIQTELLLMHNANFIIKPMTFPQYIRGKSLISRLQLASLTKCMKQHLGSFMEISEFSISDNGTENELEYKFKISTAEHGRSLAFWPAALPQKQFGNLQNLLDSFSN